MTLPSLQLLDWLVIVAFFAATLGIGLYFSRRATTDLAQYFTAGGKMTWWLAGTSIVATTFAADTPLVLAGWVRTVGIEQNWIWWGSLLGSMLCTFFYARLWKRSGLLTDIEFCELRYTGRSARVLRGFQATYQPLVTNTLVMGWVTLAMAKIMEVTLDIPTFVFIQGSFVPELVPKGVDVFSVLSAEQVAHWPLIGQAIIPAKATGILLCLAVAAFYSAISGLWGVIATDFFQFAFAMVGIYVFMAIVFVLGGGPSNLIDQARDAVAQGKVHNRLALERSLFPAEEFEKRIQSDATNDDRAMGGAGENSKGVSLAALKDAGWIEADASGVYRWNLDGWTESELRLELAGWPEKSASALIELWKRSYTFPQGKIGDHSLVQRLMEAGLIHRDSAEGKPREYYRFPTVRVEEAELTQRIREAGISDQSAPLAAWRNDESVSVSKITKFLPPFDLKGGGLMAVWSFIVFIGLQWWASAAGGGYLAQRLFSCKNEKHSMLAILWFNLAHFALRPWPWLVVGVASLFMIPDITEYGKHFDAEYAYVVMFMKFLPVGLRGLMVASLMAAFMSTISTHVNFGASYLVNDFYKRFLNRHATDRHYVRVSEILSVLLAILAGVYAFYSSSIADSWLTIFMLLSGTSFVYLLRWYWWRVNAWSEIGAMIASIVVSLLLMHTQFFQAILGPLGVPRWWFDHYPVQYTLTILLSTVVWVIVTLLTRPVSMEHLVEFYRRVGPAGWWRPVADAAGRPDHLKVGLVEWGCWLIGSSGLIAMIIALGKLCFGMYLSALGLAVYAAVATVLLFKGIGRMDWSSLEGSEKESVPKAG